MSIELYEEFRFYCKMHCISGYENNHIIDEKVHFFGYDIRQIANDFMNKYGDN